MANQNQGQGWGQQKQGQGNPVEEEKRSPSRPVDDDYKPRDREPGAQAFGLAHRAGCGRRRNRRRRRARPDERVPALAAPPAHGGGEDLIQTYPPSCIAAPAHS